MKMKQNKYPIWRTHVAQGRYLFIYLSTLTTCGCGTRRPFLLSMAAFRPDSSC